MGEVAADWVSWIRRKMSKKYRGDDFWGVAGVVGKMSQKCLEMSWGPVGVQLGFGKMSNKCQKNVPRHFRDIFVEGVFMTLNVPKGARREAPRPLGAFSVTKTALKCQKNVPKMSGDIFGAFF